MEKTAENTFFFGDFELSGAKRSLLKGGEAISLNSKTFDLLFALVENHGQILSKDEILGTVWEGQFVEENNLTVQISALRKILGETKGEHQFIATITGKGYKFVHEIRQNASNSLVKIDGAAISNANVEIIGRESEIAEIKDLLRQNERLITLTGAGGSGKTALARAVAETVRSNYADGTFFIELASINQPELVADAIAQKIGIKETGGKNLLDALKDFLRERACLLVLDNFEQILSASVLLSELLEASANLQILVTSRTALRVQSEREKQILPLNVPPNLNLSAEEFAAFSSVELFAIRAQTARANFALNTENAPIVAAICRKLDGLPLAVELAAARVRLLSPSAILSRLEKSLDLLTGGAKDSPSRQRTMRGAIEWSYELLDADERKLFRYLSVFADGFTVEGAENLVENDAALSLSVLDSLDSLINNSLLVSNDLPNGDVRLRMLEVVREFAFEMLEKSGEAEYLRQIHAQIFLALAEKAEPFLMAEVVSEWFEKLENEHDNFRAALAWSLKNDGETAAQMAVALRYFWLDHAHFSEGLYWSKAALEVTENTVSKERSMLLLANGVFLKKLGEFEAARKNCEQALTESKETNDLPQIIRAYHGLAAVAVLQKDYVSAKNYTEEVLALNRELNDEIMTANTLCSLGDLEMSLENYSSARPLFEESLLLSKKLGGKRLLSIIYFNLGAVDYFQNQPDAAGFNFTESLRIAQEVGNKMLISCSLDGFAALAAKSGNARQSAKLAGAAETLRESIGYKNEPAEEIFREKYLAIARAVLNPQDFTAAYETGRSLNFNELIALTKIKTFDFSDSSDEKTSEIIIETRQISHIIIEESEN